MADSLLEQIRNFDPNAAPAAMWATYLPSRRGYSAFKLHRKRAHAINAFLNHAYGIIYKWDTETNCWAEQARVEGPFPKDQRCDFCGGGDGGRLYRPFKRVFRKDRAGGKIVEPLDLQTLCTDCRER